MDVLARYLERFDVLKHYLFRLYGLIASKRIVRKAMLSFSGVFFVYFVFVRRRDGKKRKTVVKEPCLPDQPYTGHEEPRIVLELPILDNWLMIAICRRLYPSIFGSYLVQSTLKKASFHLPDAKMPEGTTFNPIVVPDEDLRKQKAIREDEIWRLIEDRTENKGEFYFNSISDFISLYRQKEITPSFVANSILNALNTMKTLHPDIKCIIQYNKLDVLEMAEGSTERWAAGKPLSVFDGIPVAVKDEYIVNGYPCRNGLPLRIFDKTYKLEDERGLVKKLREGGAIFIGITNMHQIGIGTFGINQSGLHGTSRNPYNTNYSTSGSSGGSAAAIAAGLCPVALGTDGGGSIRLPAATCGVVGLKATYGRYSIDGLHANASTVSHSGPLCSSVRDTAISYGMLAGYYGDDNPASAVQPPVTLGDWENTDLNGIIVGVDYNWLTDTDAELKAGLNKAIGWLEKKHNATIVSIQIPEKEEFTRALMKTITAEMGNRNNLLYEQHYDDLNIDVISSLKVGRSVSGNEYLQCARQRTRSMNALKYLFSQVDVIISPAFSAFQPVVTPSREKYGYSNLTYTAAICRFAVLANLTGIPAITLPVGYNKDNLPVPIQIMASWWREDLLLKVANAVESNMTVKKPNIHFNVTR